MIYITAIIDINDNKYTITSCINSDNVLFTTIPLIDNLIDSSPFWKEHSPSLLQKGSFQISLKKLLA